MRLKGLVISGLVLTLIASCRDDRKVDISSRLNPRAMPTMTSKDVETIISDSGRVHYKIVTPKWVVYDETMPPYWHFPQGLYLIEYDEKMKQVASVACDSARYYKNDRLWKLMGNVEMHRAPKDRFISQRLFWNQRNHTISSDTFMHIETATHTLEGTGFISDERLNSYRVIKPKGIFPAQMSDLKSGTSGNETASLSRNRVTPLDTI